MTVVATYRMVNSNRWNGFQYASWCTLLELSTPFLQHFRATKSPLSGALFVASFFIIRVIFLTWLTYFAYRAKVYNSMFELLIMICACPYIHSLRNYQVLDTNFRRTHACFSFYAVKLYVVHSDCAKGEERDAQAQQRGEARVALIALIAMIPRYVIKECRTRIVIKSYLKNKGASVCSANQSPGSSILKQAPPPACLQANKLGALDSLS